MYTTLRKSKHITGVCTWLTYCIYIYIQMVYTLSLANAINNTVTSRKYTHGATSHKYTHGGVERPANTSGGSTIRLLFERRSCLWGGGRKEKSDKSSHHRRAFTSRQSERTRDKGGCFPREAIRQSRAFVNPANFKRHRHVNAGIIHVK
jgi:hypothetical protein